MLLATIIQITVTEKVRARKEQKTARRL